MYDGARPDPKLACCDKPPWSYQPMQKQGAIILGTTLAMIHALSEPPSLTSEAGSDMQV